MGLIKDLFNVKKAISEHEQKLSQLKVDKENLQVALTAINKEKELAINSRDVEVKKTDEECKAIIDKYLSDTESAKSAFETAFEQKENIEKTLFAVTEKATALEAKAKTYRQLFNKINKKILLDEDATIEVDLLLSLTPTTELNLYSFQIKQLRSLYNENKKLIDLVLRKYESRYTTKTNKAIYQLMILALQAECQNILIDMKFGTIDKAKEQLNNMLQKYLVIVTEGNQTIAPTIKSFMDEIGVLFEKSIEIEYTYYEKKEQAKAEQMALREQMRQEAAEAKALAVEKEKIEKEELKYRSEIENIKLQISDTEDSDKNIALLQRIKELETMLADVEVKKEEITTLQNGKAGNVYVISNLGSFGENIFKVGMTRRIDPQERVNELGDASVPFAFDVHSFIFSQDAVKLEADIHKMLTQKRVNKINTRKEFFNTTIDELETLICNIEPTAIFNRTMAAEQYRQSLSMGKDAVMSDVDDEFDD